MRAMGSLRARALAHRQPQVDERATAHRTQYHRGADALRSQQPLHLPVVADGLAVPGNDNITEQHTPNRGAALAVDSGYEEPDLRVRKLPQRLRQPHGLHRDSEIAANHASLRKQLLSAAGYGRRRDDEQRAPRAEDRHAEEPGVEIKNGRPLGGTAQ